MDKIIIYGLGAVGATYADKFQRSENAELKILVDKERLKKYTNHPVFFNGKETNFDYITPEANFEADLIIISTKFDGLNSAIKDIQNFVSSETTIISLINGISSEKILKEHYPLAKILKSYFVGHSAVRNDNYITQDGIGEIVIEPDKKTEEIFKRNNINYSVSNDIDYSMWLKYTMNLFSNQTSAILNMNFGQLKHNENFIDFAKKIVKEVIPIAEKEGIRNLENLEEDSLKLLDRMCNEGKTSMHQDILAGRKTEVDMFAGEIIKLGKKYNIPTPYNQILYDMIKIIENRNSY